MLKKILFIDRDGTLIDEPADHQVDSIAKFKLKPNVVPALLQLKQAGYTFVMVTNQDGLGTMTFPEQDFVAPQQLLIEILASQGIEFAAVHICPHTTQDHCSCRKPKLGLVMPYLGGGTMDFTRSYVIGDRATDVELADNMQIKGLRYHDEQLPWPLIAEQILQTPRRCQLQRVTTETRIDLCLDLDQNGTIAIHTTIGFFDHMLAQLAKHAGISLTLQASGDVHIDEHHLVEDTALALGQALRQALGDKHGINRYGFLLPMDEALAEIALDLSGRPYCQFSGKFSREKIGEFPTELVPHFFRSLTDTLGATLHIKSNGENNHHMIESIFKAFGRTLQQAIKLTSNELPSTKGVL